MKTLLITGASSGIGAATSELAASRGWKVFLGYRTGRDRAEAIVGKLKSRGSNVASVRLALEERSSISPALDQVAKNSDRLDAIVLCGSPSPALTSFLKTTPDQMLDQLTPNLLGHLHLIQEAYKRFFRPQKAGRILAVLSQAAEHPVWPHMTSYVVAKRALQALVECAEAEFGREGVRAHFISPDYTETPMLTSIEPRVLEAARAKRPNGFRSAADVAGDIMKAFE